MLISESFQEYNTHFVSQNITADALILKFEPIR